MFRFLRPLRKAFTSSTPRRPRPQRPQLEVLEDRLAPAVGAEFHVNTTTDGQQSAAANASSTSVRVVVWVSSSPAGQEIRGQRYNADRVRLGGEFLVTRQTGVNSPAVAINSSGNFVVSYAYDVRTPAGSWDSNIAVQRFDRLGQPVGGPIDVEASNRKETFPAVALADNGRVTIANTRWEAQGATVQGHIFRFSDGARLASIPVATGGRVLAASHASVAMAADGRIAIAYRAEFTLMHPTRGNPVIVLSRWWQDGTFMGGVTASVATWGIDVTSPKVASDSAFNLVVTYMQRDHDGAWDVLALRQSNHRRPITKLLTLASGPDNQTFPQVALAGVGFFVVTYGVTQHGTGLSWSNVVVVKADNTIKSTHNLGAGTNVSGLSMSGLRFLITAAIHGRTDDPGWGIFGWLGHP